MLVTSKNEYIKLQISQLDIILITGDAFIDHPSFGAAIIGRYLEAKGFTIGIISQPNWKSNEDFRIYGKPKYFFGITAGNMDSMINHYTAQKKIRTSDAYTPLGLIGKRPNRATIVYAQKVRSLYKNTKIVIGGIEASLRRIPHYDYWSDKLRNSILIDSKADILVYGMGERAVGEIANSLKHEQIIPLNIRGTVVLPIIYPPKMMLYYLNFQKIFQKIISI